MLKTADMALQPECKTHLFMVSQSKETTMLCKEHANFAFNIVINCACRGITKED